jgi:hypothetical protein
MSDDTRPNLGDEPAATPPPESEGPLPNRFTRGTFLGCLGIACVLGMAALLALPLDVWRVPEWVGLLVPLVAFGALALGAWLLARVPAGRLPSAPNPWRPLTGAGAPPLVERPATASNRVGAAFSLTLLLAGLVAFVALSAGLFQRHATLAAVVVMGVAGAALAGYGLLVTMERLPPPAWRWVRTPIRGGGWRAGAPLLLAGLAGLAWSLLVAAQAGYPWGPVGLALLVLASVAAAPLARRAPPGER